MEALLKSAADAEIPAILDMADVIYYLGRPQQYGGIVYTPKDLPSDDLYDQYRKQYTPKVMPGDHLSAADTDDEKVKHEFAMGSLTKVLREDFNVQSIINAAPFIETEKLDGVSMITTFVDGRLVRALTRYDKVYGRNIIDKATHFVTRPDPTKAKGKLVVKGEVLFIGDSYREMGMATPQNAVTGILGRKEPSDLDKLEYIVFDLVYLDGYSEDDELKRLMKAKSMGFRIPRYTIADKLDVDQLEAQYEKWRSTSPYAIDGVVIAPVKHAFENVETPRRKLAFKVQAQGKWTTVLRITARATRTGNVIPHIEIEPIDIEGVTITFIAGATYDRLRERKITVGSRVRVIRSMQTIPYIIEVDNSKIDYKPIADPTTCPSCSTPLVKVGKFLKCPNANCPEKKTKIPVYFFQTMGLENFGEKLIESLKLDTIEDAYNYTVGALQKIEGFAKSRADDFVKSIRKILVDVNSAVLLEAFGIPLIGNRNAMLILSELSLEDLFGIDTKTGKPLDSYAFPRMRLRTISGIGESKIDAIERFVPRARTLITFLVGQGMTISKQKVVASTISGKTFVLTGRGEHPRGWYVTEINKRGAAVKTAVSSKTDYLVTDSLDARSKKIRDAERLQIPIISYSELEKML